MDAVLKLRSSDMHLLHPLYSSVLKYNIATYHPMSMKEMSPQSESGTKNKREENIVTTHNVTRCRKGKPTKSVQKQ